ncbi:unnamed protein product [Zymoseptoria tritici ST99CH_1A5]|uniref:Fungal calcium binding protein domain-containing protein n=1 Tax=Zymoseptoria tritici ST99CH_1A5 TaxID=1276529 RepID=A0A1Y6LND6_ZYMTR|nr:unnamed protein product [Zymoseptoria tritici ST99CH_3D1]SMY25932.1 unnamed protein product [Zymoseptoria tritici ST99CH_1A5]
MQFSTVVIAAFAAITYASPVEVRDIHEEKISLPSGCTKSDIVKCIYHLGSTTASCATALAMAGADPAADLLCVASASGTAEHIDECKACIPKKSKREEFEEEQTKISLPKGCNKVILRAALSTWSVPVPPVVPP